MADIHINGDQYTVEDGQMIIEAADRLGIEVPRFCYHRNLSVAANCRMCLVEVEKMRKPVPACATPVSDGMSIHTHSDAAVDARRGIMEFLLINHPLDCPICDQGGECDLQDLAMAHGSGHSRFGEPKRSVEDEELGPLIATEMTRCIHCTRCVRFTDEVAGVQELGGTFRGEHTEIGTYVGRAVTSELSGNVIDLCPVGALTSKPYRYSARPWEMTRQPSVCPHCSVGCNLELEEVQGEVKRVLPRTNDAVNGEWLCDKGRFSYEALENNRVTEPHVFEDGAWRPVSWEVAFERASAGLRHAGRDVAGLVAPTATLEEQWLTQHLVRGLGGRDVDHRQALADQDLDSHIPWSAPVLGLSLEELEAVDAAVVIGGNPRKEQPLANHRLHNAVRKGARISALGPVAFPRNFDHYRDLVHAAGAEAAAATALAGAANGTSAAEASAEAGLDSDQLTDLAHSLQAVDDAVVLIGAQALEHPQAGEIIGQAAATAAAVGARLGYLAPYANSVGGWVAGCVPHRGPGGAKVTAGQPAPVFLGTEGRSAYVVVGADPLVEAADPRAAAEAFAGADHRIVITSHWSATAEAADVVLPAAAYAENHGAYVSGEGRVQAIAAAAPAPGEARPAWKILRVLAHGLGVPGSEFVEVGEVREKAEAAVQGAGIHVGVAPAWPAYREVAEALVPGGLWRIPARHIYHDDLFVRNAPALQAQFGGLAAALHPDTAEDLGVKENTEVRFSGAGGAAWLPVQLDSAVPSGGVWLPAGEAAAGLGPTYGAVTVTGHS